MADDAHSTLQRLGSCHAFAVDVLQGVEDNKITMTLDKLESWQIGAQSDRGHDQAKKLSHAVRSPETDNFEFRYSRVRRMFHGKAGSGNEL